MKAVLERYLVKIPTSADKNAQPFELIELIEPFEQIQQLKPHKSPKPLKRLFPILILTFIKTIFP